LNDLMEAGLLSFNSSGCYELTSKGKMFLDRFNEYTRHCEMVEEHMNNLDEERKNLENICSNAEEVDEK